MTPGEVGSEFPNHTGAGEVGVEAASWEMDTIEGVVEVERKMLVRKDVDFCKDTLPRAVVKVADDGAKLCGDETLAGTREPHREIGPVVVSGGDDDTVGDLEVFEGIVDAVLDIEAEFVRAVELNLQRGEEKVCVVQPIVEIRVEFDIDAGLHFAKPWMVFWTHCVGDIASVGAHALSTDESEGRFEVFTDFDVLH